MRDIDKLSAPTFRVTTDYSEPLSPVMTLHVDVDGDNLRGRNAAVYVAASYVEIYSVGERWLVVPDARKGTVTIETPELFGDETERAELVLRRVAQELS